MIYRKVTFVLKRTLKNLSVYGTCQLKLIVKHKTLFVAGEEGYGLLDRDWLSSLQLHWKKMMNHRIIHYKMFYSNIVVFSGMALEP